MNRIVFLLAAFAISLPFFVFRGRHPKNDDTDVFRLPFLDRLSYNQRLPFLLSMLAFFVLVTSPRGGMARDIDSLFLSRFRSAAGGFSIDVPRTWDMPQIADMREPLRFFPDTGETFLYSQHHHTIRLQRRHSHRNIFETVRVVEIPLPEGTSPTPEDLAYALRERINEQRESNNDAGGTLGFAFPEVIGEVRTVIRPFGRIIWAKTTRTYSNMLDEDCGVVYYQAVIDDSHYCVAVFSTNYFTTYEPLFDKMMRSFRLEAVGR